MQQHLWVLFGSFIQQVLLSQACLPLPISFIQLLRLSGPELGAYRNRNRVFTLRDSPYDWGGKCLRGQAQHRLVLVMMGVKLGLKPGQRHLCLSSGSATDGLWDSGLVTYLPEPRICHLYNGIMLGRWED